MIVATTWWCGNESDVIIARPNIGRKHENSLETTFLHLDNAENTGSSLFYYFYNVAEPALFLYYGFISITHSTPIILCFYLKQKPLWFSDEHI